jgi:hypothetical protein
MPVYSAYWGTSQPRCIKFDFGKEKKSSQGIIYYEIKGCYYDFDGKVLREASKTLVIPKFCGAQWIKSLSCFPLKYYSDGQIR